MALSQSALSDLLAALPIHGKDGASGPGDQRPTKKPAYLTPPNFAPDGPT